MVYVGRFGRGNDLFICSIRRAIADVVPDRSGEQPRVLQHHSEQRAKVAAGIILDVVMVYEYIAAVEFVIAHQQFDDRRLPCAGVADYGDARSGFCDVIEILDYRLARFVSECDIAEAYLTLMGNGVELYLGRVVSSEGVFFLFLFDKLKYPLSCGSR